MNSLKNNTIHLTRGDTFQTQVTIKQNGEDYIPEQGDVIRFAAKRDELNHNGTQYLDKEPLIVKQIPIDTMILRLDPEDTANLDFNVYAYDIEITMANGRVDTFISDKLYLDPEVH